MWVLNILLQYILKNIMMNFDWFSQNTSYNYFHNKQKSKFKKYYFPNEIIILIIHFKSSKEIVFINYKCINFNELNIYKIIKPAWYCLRYILINNIYPYIHKYNLKFHFIMLLCWCFWLNIIITQQSTTQMDTDIMIPPIIYFLI